MPMDTDVTVTAHAVKVLFDQLQNEQRHPAQQIEDVQKRLVQRASLRSMIRQFEKQVTALEDRLEEFPRLPDIQVVSWARSIRLFPNLVFLEVDTTGLNANAEIIRVCVLSADQSVLLDLYAQPSQPIPSFITNITGVTNEQVTQHGQPIETVLERLRATLQGKYVLSYNLDFDRTKLREATTRAQLPVIGMVADDLMEKAMQYFAYQSYPKLATLCEKVGYPLPAQPNQQIQDRARGQYHLLHALADLFQEAISEEQGDDFELDDHPF